MKIVFVSCDTLRADHLSCYGYALPTSPRMDRIASEGVLFERAFAADLPTEVVHTDIFTGRLGIDTGIVAHGAPRAHLPKHVPWLPILLRDAGLTTAAVDNLYQLKEWFVRGYRYYINSVGKQRWIDGADVNAHALPWLRQHADEDFFLFIHYWDPHIPYLVPPSYRDLFYHSDPFDSENESMQPVRRQPVYPFFHEVHYQHLGPVTDARYISAQYDAEIRYLDDRIAELDDTLQELGIAEETLLIFFGDHGESLYEHDIYWDHAGLYEATVHVPVIMRWPKVIPEGVQISALVQQIDLFPTLLEAAGIETPEGTGGRSLWPLIREERTDQYEQIFLSECSWQAARGIRTKDWKLIQNIDEGLYRRPPFELYHIDKDPDETVNLIDREPDVAHTLKTELLSWVDSRLGSRVDPIREVLATTGMPAEPRLDRTLAKWGLTWRDWVQNPDLRRIGLA